MFASSTVLALFVLLLVAFFALLGFVVFVVWLVKEVRKYL